MKKTVLSLMAGSALLCAGSFDQSQFVPDISLIVDSSVVTHSKSDTELQSLYLPSLATSFIQSSEDEQPMNAKNGFNYNYAELTFHSAVDSYFELDAIFHMGVEELETEESYITSTALPYHLQLRAGKFRSHFGRLNRQHQHIQEFSESALVYQAFLGNEGLNDIGVQLHYLAPFSEYLLLGAELFQGQNDFNSTVAPDRNSPNSAVLYMKSSFDIEDTTLLYGASYLYSRAPLSEYVEGDEVMSIVPKRHLFGLDATLKHYFDSYSSLTWQSEWLQNRISGSTYDADMNLLASSSKKQAGFYTQLVYVQDLNLRYGLRYDNIYQNRLNSKSQSSALERYSLMCTYSFSEFSKLRLQYNRNRALYSSSTKRESLDSIILEMNVAIGAHAAHTF